LGNLQSRTIFPHFAVTVSREQEKQAVIADRQGQTDGKTKWQLSETEVRQVWRKWAAKRRISWRPGSGHCVLTEKIGMAAEMIVSISDFVDCLTAKLLHL